MKQISVLMQHHAGPTGDILIGKKANGVWEFPTGLIRTNETEAEAAKRLIAELFGIDAVVGKLILEGHKKPADGYVEHIVCGNITHNTHSKKDWHYYYEAVNKWQSEPICKGGYEELKYVHASELCKYEFEGDDANFMKKYGPWVNGLAIPDVRMY